MLGDELDDFVVHVEVVEPRAVSQNGDSGLDVRGWISAINPHSNRERSRSSRLEDLLGRRSELMMI